MKGILSRSLHRLAVVLLGLALALPAGAGAAQDQDRPSQPASDEDAWPMVAANPARTSWTPEAVSGNLHVEWYRPIEAYIPQNAQLIAAGGLIYVATARGLYALNAANGEVAWRFDTALPLGNSPTVAHGVVYVGGHDRRLHALDARTGTHLWSFDGAQAGYDTNPLVVDGTVYAGNRDGNMYAVGAHGSPNQGRLIWKYQTGGPIHLSAAYKDGRVFFASNDNYAYALSSRDGRLAWRSARLPGDGYQAYWPVVYQDKVIFAAASGYRTGLEAGTADLKDAGNESYGKIFDMDRDAVFDIGQTRDTVGPRVADAAWANGYPIVDVSAITEYLENNPAGDALEHKPWRRAFVVLNQGDGSEYTFDSDGDGSPEYMPVVMWGTHSGNRYPPVAGPDGILYQSNIYQNMPIPQGRVMGWQLGTARMSVLLGNGAVDEPQALSAGGNLIYRSICCDRVGDYFPFDRNGRPGLLWHYSDPLSKQAPGYDEMWSGIAPKDTARLHGNYGTQNGIYNSHGYQNPIIPYAGRLYIHRSNAVIAYGTGQGLGKLPLLRAQAAPLPAPALTPAVLEGRLTEEIRKMLAAGRLRPGYYNAGQFSVYRQFADYFANPGDTLVTLARAYPYLSPALQVETAAYLQQEFKTYFDPAMSTHIGWAGGAAREAMPLPPEVEKALQAMPASSAPDNRWSWQYPPHNFYALWKYAEIVPADVQRAYELAKSRLVAPVPARATNDYLIERPYELNAYVAGYVGFLGLQALAGQNGPDATLRGQVSQELDRLMALRADYFSKDTPWATVGQAGRYHNRTLNVSRNFIFLVPELGAYLNQQALAKVQTALSEYNDVAPYWFVSRYEAAINEGAAQHLYDYPALFQARAYILKQPLDSLGHYLDVPAFARGDLNYINNLIAALDVAGVDRSRPGHAPTVPPTGKADGTVSQPLARCHGTWSTDLCFD